MQSRFVACDKSLFVHRSYLIVDIKHVTESTGVEPIAMRSHKHEGRHGRENMSHVFSRLLPQIVSSCMQGRGFADITPSAECIEQYDGKRGFLAGPQGGRTTLGKSCIDSFRI